MRHQQTFRRGQPRERFRAPTHKRFWRDGNPGALPPCEAAPDWDPIRGGAANREGFTGAMATRLPICLLPLPRCCPGQFLTSDEAA